MAHSARAGEKHGPPDGKYRAIFEASPVAVVVFDAASRHLLDVNRAFERASGYRRDEVLGRQLADLDMFLEPELVEELGDRALAEGGVPEAIMAGRRKDGEVRSILLACVVVEVDGDVLLVGTGQDVSSLKETEQALRHRAFHDALTDLPNRDLLWDRCEHALARAERTGHRVGLLYLDLDGFKPINDLHGHIAGDAVLKEVAKRLQAAVRGEDTIARIGGDEFVALLEEIADRDDVQKSVERVMRTLEKPVSIDGGETFRISASCGAVVVVPDEMGDGWDDHDLHERVRHIIDRADQEMYAAKSTEPGSYRITTLP